MSPRAQAAANAILEFAASLLSLVYGLALIALAVFGVYAAFFVVLFEEVPPLMHDNPALQVFLVLGVAWALLQHWVGNRLANAALQGQIDRADATMGERISKEIAALNSRGRGWRS